MSEEEAGFLSRWSRRKAASRAAPAPVLPDPPEPPPQDLPELPPLESLDINSDYTVFLARGVSRAVQAQALGIAWASDPAIADFRGMAEYAWDFNAPGYGDLAPGDDAAVWLSQIVRSGAKLAAVVEPAMARLDEPPLQASPAEPEPPEAIAPPLAVVADAAVPPPDLQDREPDPVAVPACRRHGGAVPA